MLNKSNANKRRRKRPRVDPDQLGLGFGQTPSQVIALRSIDFKATGLSFYAWRQVKELAIAISYCGLRSGCRASRGALLRVANENQRCSDRIIGSLSVLTRALRKASKLGLLESKSESNSKGNAPPLRWINEEVLTKLVFESQKLYQKTTAKPQQNENSDPHPNRTRLTPDPHCPYTTTTLTSSTNLNSRSTVDHKKSWTKGEIYIVRQKANEAVEKLGRPVVKADRDLLAKACFLTFISRVLSEHCFYDAIEGVVSTKPKNQYAYFQSVLADNARKFGRVLNHELAQLAVPAELLNRPNPQINNDMSKRLCVEEDV